MDQQAQEKLEQYAKLLKKWQPKINLVSNGTLNNLWERHFIDSIQVSDYIATDAKKLFDLGSGGGFPGMVLAILRPDINVSLIESDQKKCVFLKTVSRETNTAVTIYNERIESVSCETVPDVITARALASLSDLFSYCEKWIIANPDIQLVFLKGARAEEEMDALSKLWKYDCRTYDSTTEKEAKILVFSKVSRVS